MSKNEEQEKMLGKLQFKLIYLIFFILLITGLLTSVIFFILSYFKIVRFLFPRGAMGYVLALLIVSLILGTAIGYFLTRRFFKPLRELSAATKKIANGDFSVTISDSSLSEDDTEMQTLIANFNSMAEQLSKIETLRSDFIANVSHEFKTPLSTIQGYVTLLEDDKLTPEERKNYIRIIFDATTKLTNLTSNILKISKLENQEIEFDKKEYNLSEQIRETIILLQSSWETKQIEFDLDLPDCMIVSDEELLQQVWMNIISNAIKFSYDNGIIKVYLSATNDFITVKIIDTGCGMDEETIKYIFDKFYQGDKSHSKEGNGLGLALAKKIVLLAHGEIKAESILDEGTTMIIKLPVHFN
jgi:signal transduction histidine kinase